MAVFSFGSVADQGLTILAVYVVLSQEKMIGTLAPAPSSPYSTRWQP